MNSLIFTYLPYFCSVVFLKPAVPSVSLVARLTQVPRIGLWLTLCTVSDFIYLLIYLNRPFEQKTTAVVRATNVAIGYSASVRVYCVKGRF